MVQYLLFALGLDLCVLVCGFSLQRRFLRHLRHRHRDFWEALQRQSPRSWRYYKGMPSTGLLLIPILADERYRKQETRGWRWLGRMVVALNLLHALMVTAVLSLAVALFFLS